MECKKFTGGYCENIGMFVPKSWCVNRCQNGANTMHKKRPKPKKPSITQMGLHFAKAMTKWIRAGTPVCSKETYLERRTLCSECHDGSSCPVCGCQLWAKAALETEKCPNALW